MSALRWEDDASVWQGPTYVQEAIAYHPDVKSAPVAGRIITCVDVVDWDGDGGRDLLLSSWDACYDGRVFLYPQIGTNADGTPILGRERVVEGVRGYVTTVRDGETFHLVSASRMRRQIYLFPNIGSRTEPRFGHPIALDLDADWVKGNEFYHMARFHDIDGDGFLELVVGTDHWDEYWPNGLEWNDEGYRAYDAAGRWLGGPLRGFLYAFKNRGTLSAPILDRGKPIRGGETPLEVYGQCAPAFGDFLGKGSADVVCGEFWNILHYARQTGPDSFEQPVLIADSAGEPLMLDHCIHMPCAVDWDGDGKVDILVGAEDGYVTYLRNVGERADGRPAFERVGRVEGVEPKIHAGVLPSPAAHDFNGNGLPDLVVGNSTGELLFYENLGPRNAPRLGREVMIEAAGKAVRVTAGLPGSIQGPSETMFGYTCPTIADWDGDGLPDLLVSDVNGDHCFYRNAGGRVPPRFEAPRRLIYQGKPLKTVWRVRPSVVDWVGDGQLHYLALDEDGVLSDYRRVSDTELADKRFPRWQDGSKMRFTVDVGGGRGRVKLCVVDWTGDGRLDIILGTNGRHSVPPGPTGQPRNTTGQAGIFLLENIGSNAEPLFAFPQAMKLRGETIQMAMHVASADAVDWDGSGKLGLVVGVEDGSLVWLPRDDLSW